MFADRFHFLTRGFYFFLPTCFLLNGTSINDTMRRLRSYVSDQKKRECYVESRGEHCLFLTTQSALWCFYGWLTKSGFTVSSCLQVCFKLSFVFISFTRPVSSGKVAVTSLEFQSMFFPWVRKTNICLKKMFFCIWRWKKFAFVL